MYTVLQDSSECANATKLCNSRQRGTLKYLYLNLTWFIPFDCWFSRGESTIKVKIYSLSHCCSACPGHWENSFYNLFKWRLWGQHPLHTQCPKPHVRSLKEHDTGIWHLLIQPQMQVPSEAIRKYLKLECSMLSPCIQGTWLLFVFSLLMSFVNMMCTDTCPKVNQLNNLW